MKTISSSRLVKIPAGVKVELNGRKITVTGPRGTLMRDLGHQSIEVTRVDESTLKLTKWNGTKKEIAAIRSLCASIDNMVTGVTKGFRYKMRLVSAHFPISVVINGKDVKIMNFLGKREALETKMRGNTTIELSKDIKDCLILEGNDIDDVSQSAADISQKCKVRHKDIRKFLDGVYVSEKGPIQEE